MALLWAQSCQVLNTLVPKEQKHTLNIMCTSTPTDFNETTHALQIKHVLR